MPNNCPQAEGAKSGNVRFAPPYTFDLVVKTPVPEIRIIDGDDFLTHNAFRAPGAASLEELRQVQKKVHYLAGIYSKMHRGIVPHAVALDPGNLHLLDGATFAFISMDAGEPKRLAVQKCEQMGIPFVDVGMGLELVEGSLGGILRVTSSTPEMRAHVHNGRISFCSGDEENLYATNIQVADLNALNAAMAVIKWKKRRASIGQARAGPNRRARSIRSAATRARPSRQSCSLSSSSTPMTTL